MDRRYASKRRTPKRVNLEHIKLTVAEGLALIDAIERELGTVPLTAALIMALGPVKATTLITERKGVRLTKEEVVALVKAIYPLVPGATVKDKLVWIVRMAKPAFATQERYLAVIRYVKERIKLFAAGQEYDGGTSPGVPAPGGVPSWDACTRASCWNGSNAQQRMMNMLSTGMPESTFDLYLGWMVGLGCNVAHVFMANLADGPHAAPGCSIYGEGKQWSWKRNAAVIAHFNARIDKICARMAYVPWLMADDSSLYAAAAASNPEKYAEDLAAAGVFRRASFVCLGLEMNEYWKSDAVVARFAAAVRRHYSGKIATHHSSGQWTYAKHGDLVMYQINPGASPSKIAAEIKKVRAATGKPVCMFEMERHPASDAQLKAAHDAEAFSTGNWNGTSAALFLPASIPAPAPLAVDSILPSQVRWLGPNYRSAKVTKQLTSASISGNHLNFKLASPLGWPKSGSKNVDGIGFLIRKIGGEYVGGKVEWCVSSRGWYDIKTNVEDGYNGSTMPKSGETVWCGIGHPVVTSECTNLPKVVWP